MQTELISILIPFYNRERYIRSCIDSCLSQKDVSFEIILVDDGSDDGSPAICDEYAQKYNNITVIHNPHIGVSHTRNCALDAARGNYIFFLDSDDTITSDALITLMDYLKKYDLNCVAGNRAIYTTSGSLDHVVEISDYARNVVIDDDTILRTMVDMDYPVIETITGKLYRRSVFDNLRFPEGMTCEDSYILPELMKRIPRHLMIDKPIYNIVLSDNSIVRSVTPKKLLDSTEATYMMIDYIADKQLYDIAIYKFGLGTRKLLNAKRQFKDKQTKKEIKRIYRLYRKVAKKFIPHVNLKNKMRFILFVCNFSVYGKVRDFFGE